MYFEEISKPSLTESGVKYFLHQSLKQSHEFKNRYKNYIFNVAMFIGFFLVLAAILASKYKGRMTPEELEEKERVKQQYILSKIRNFQDAKRIAHQELITSLPTNF
jgi:hypothetical protein